MEIIKTILALTITIILILTIGLIMYDAIKGLQKNIKSIPEWIFLGLGTSALLSVIFELID